MAWIKTIPPNAATGPLRAAYELLGPLFPPEYYQPVPALERPGKPPESVVALHSLLPGVMAPMFTALANLMRPELPLTRRQQEMINTVVSSVNRCVY